MFAWSVKFRWKHSVRPGMRSWKVGCKVESIFSSWFPSPTVQVAIWILYMGLLLWEVRISNRPTGRWNQGWKSWESKGLPSKQTVCGGSKKPSSRPKFIIAIFGAKFDEVVNGVRTWEVRCWGCNGRIIFVLKHFCLKPISSKISSEKVKPWELTDSYPNFKHFQFSMAALLGVELESLCTNIRP